MGKASEAERERSGVTMEELKGIARMHYRKHRRVKRLGQMKKIVCVLGIITICILIIGAATGKDRVISDIDMKAQTRSGGLWSIARSI